MAAQLPTGAPTIPELYRDELDSCPMDTQPTPVHHLMRLTSTCAQENHHPSGLRFRDRPTPTPDPPEADVVGPYAAVLSDAPLFSPASSLHSRQSEFDRKSFDAAL